MHWMTNMLIQLGQWCLEHSQDIYWAVQTVIAIRKESRKKEETTAGKQMVSADKDKLA